MADLVRVFRRLHAPVLVLAALAACAPEGGELREATERRRLASRAADTVSGTAAARDSVGEYRLPAFVDTSAAPDSAAPAMADTTPAAPAAPRGQPEWSADAREAGTPGGPPRTLRGMRVGRNAGFDRLVLDFGDDPVPAYRVEYADSPPRQCGSGDAAQVAGQGWLVVRLRSAQAHDAAGRATVRERQIVATTPVLREAEIICDFEGEVEIALGVQIPNPYRVLIVPTPNRLIVDVRQ